MKKKISIEEIKIQSFITGTNKVQGGLKRKDTILGQTGIVGPMCDPDNSFGTVCFVCN